MAIQRITFDQIPEAIARLAEDVKELRLLVIETKEQQQEGQIQKREEFLNVEDAARLLHLSVATVYSKVSRGELPVMRRGKRLYFSHEELMDFIKAGRRKTNAEIENEAHNYLSTKKTG